MADILRFQDSGHQRFKRLLPWYANRTLDEAERAEVETHLATCDACREEVNDLRAVADLLDRESADAAAEAAFTRISTRLDEPDRTALGALRDWWRARGTPMLLVAQFVAVVGLSAALWRAHEAPAPDTFRTLAADGRTASSRIFTTFDPARSEADIRRTLLAAGARIVDGPTADGLYVLEAVAGGDTSRTLATLQADRAVTRADAVDVR